MKKTEKFDDVQSGYEYKHFVESIDISGGSFFSSINKKLMQPLKESAEDGI